MEFAFFLLIMCRRILWLATLILIIAIILRTIHRKPADPTDWHFFFLACAVEWYFRDAFFNIMPIYNPWAYWWERQLVPITLLASLLICAILNKIFCSGGILQNMKRLMLTFFEGISTLKAALVKIYEMPNLKWIELGLVIAAVISAVASIVTASQNSLEVYLAGGFLLLFYAGYFVHRSLYSARRLLSLWLGGATLFALIAAAASQYAAGANHLSSDYAFWLSYLTFTLFFVLGWIVTACLAEEKAAKLASSFMIAITTIGTIVGNVFLVFVQQALSTSPAIFNAAIALLTNLILLPVLSASLLASFFIDLQIYCMKTQREEISDPN